MAITGAVQFREQLYQDLGWESLHDRCRFRKLTFLYKIVQDLSPQYLTKCLRSNYALNYQIRTANKNILNNFFYRKENFKYSSFPFCVRKWNNLGNSISEAKSIKQWKSMLMQFFLLKQVSMILAKVTAEI